MDCANKEEDEAILPGFRFHPTDEELVGFYLHRKIEKKPFTIDLIKHVDIYKFDPWDLPKGTNVGDKEWYFFCKRGRKYRNSVRPNRVTSSGFWKATGIDRPIYSTTGGGRQQCIGLKKSLVYYRGSAGKGVKTEWMMHEFRLPAEHDDKSTKHIEVKAITTQEAEVWTLCRILKRNTSTKKNTPEWRDLSSVKRNTNRSMNLMNANLIACSADSETSYEEGYKIDFKDPMVTKLTQFSSLPQDDSMPTYSNDNYYPNVNELIKNGGWDDLKWTMDFDTSLSYM